LQVLYSSQSGAVPFGLDGVREVEGWGNGGDKGTRRNVNSQLLSIPNSQSSAFHTRIFRHNVFKILRKVKMFSQTRVISNGIIWTW